MITIWKFPLDLGVENVVNIDRFARVVMTAIDPDSGRPALWFEHNPHGQKADRKIVIFGTGVDIQGPAHSHMGSVIDGPLVWHIYERN